MQITFYGGAGNVTGSKFLLETEHERVLFDCGTFQGLPDIRERNRSFPFPPDSINYVVLSHAHVDHCGMLPLLVKRGFKGSIFATPATKDVARAMLLDAAGIEMQDAEYRLKHKVGAPDYREPLFTPDDIPAVMDRFVEVPYARVHSEWHEVSPNLKLKFYDAGHILGSAITVLEITDGNRVKHVAYTGDLGPTGSPLLRDAEVPAEEIDTVLLESTYGNRIHKPIAEAEIALTDLINKVASRRGKIIIPAFSLGRTQRVVYLLHKLTDEKKIPRIPMFVDSPLAVDLTEIFKQHQENFDAESEADFTGADHNPLDFRNLKYVHTKRESQRLNTLEGPFIVISASGMMTAGRVVHHLRHSIEDSRNAIVITGYQAMGTLGRRLLEGVQQVELYGEVFNVNAELHTFNEFSAHADQAQLQTFLNQWQGIHNVFLVHGEEEQADEFKKVLSAEHPAWNVERPNEGDTVSL